MQVCSEDNGSVPFDPNDVMKTMKSKHVVACTAVEKKQWWNTMSKGDNLHWTASFPCPPYSNASMLKQGLEVSAGRSLVHVLKAARIIKPLTISLENVDGFPSHPHFKAMKLMWRWAGYRMCWSQTHCLSELAPCRRRRWLAVLIRGDLVPDDFVACGRFKFTWEDDVMWTHEDFHFNLPDVLAAQLKLDQYQKVTYSDPKFLPKSMRKNDHEGWQARIPKDDADLGTLVASYTQQHILSESQLLARGIFGELVQTSDGEPAFQSPAMWCAMLGNLQTQFWPPQPAVIFHFLGNACSVPQATLACAIAINAAATLDVWLPVKDTVMQVWKHRLTSADAMCSTTNQGFGIFTISDFLLVGNVNRSLSSLGDAPTMNLHAMWPDQVESTMLVDPHMTIGEMLAWMQFDAHLIPQWGI